MMIIEERKAVLIQIAMSVIANLSILSSGMALGFPSVSIDALTQDDDPMKLSTEEVSWFASVNSIIAPIGGFLCAYLLDAVGRKKTLILVNVLAIISWSLMGFASTTNFDVFFWQLIGARCIIGLNLGLSSTPATIYSIEIANPTIRGLLSVFTSMGIAVGILTVYTLGYFFKGNFRVISLICAAICAGALLLLILMPESPRYLISKGKLKKAEKSIHFLKGIPNKKKGDTAVPTDAKVSKEMDDLQSQLNTRDSQTQTMNPITKLRKPEMYKPLAIIMTFFAFQQLSGIFVVIVYASKISVEAGVTLDPFLCTVLIGIMRVIATIAVAFTLDKFGRKPITVVAGSLMSFCMLGLAAIIQFPDFSTEYASWLPTFLLLAYIFTSTLSFLTVPFSMLPELFNQQNRGLAAGLASGFMHFASFLLIKFYPDMLDVMGIELLFVFYGGMSLIGVVFVQLFVPETKNKTLEEIEKFFKKDEPVGSSS